ncbi:MAG: 50S ribosomal protein L9 [Dehalococcoidales bacterium]|jgi:large subunit ribosomal protein L9
MKVIFMEDVPNVGKAGQIKDVADGYGTNYLIPHKLAVAAKPGDIKNVEAQIKSRARVAAKTEAEMKALAAELENKEVTIKAKVGQQDRLYGSITSADVSAALESAFKINVDKKKIELADAIRSLGTYEATIKLAKDIVAKIKVTVAAEDAA